MPTGTTATTKPLELERQATRIEEQSGKLDVMLNTISNHLTDIGRLLTDYDQNIVGQIKNLNDSVGVFRQKSQKIYSSLATNLHGYASHLRYNIESLNTNISSITQHINNL